MVMHFTTNGLTSWHLLTLLSKQAVQMEMALWTFKESGHITFEITRAKFLSNPKIFFCYFFNI